MTWLTPMLMGVAAAVAVPSLVILYFLKLRRREIEVSSTLLWKRSIQDLRANAPFQRLRRNILLILQLMALGAGLVALGQPQWRSERPPGGRSVILIDRSASMSALDETDDTSRAVSRFERAKQGALEYVDGLSDGGVFGQGSADEAMVIAFDAGAEVVLPYSASKERLRAAIRGIEPTDARTSMDEAMRLAGAYAKPVVVEDKGMVFLPGPPIVVWSDGGVSDLASLDLPAETPVSFRAVGRAGSANVGITALRAERSFQRPDAASIFVALQCTSAVATSVDVQLIVDGMVSAVRPVQLAPPVPPAEVASSGVVFELDQPEGAEIAVRLGQEDALAADNIARLVLPPARRLVVALVSTGNLFLRTAIEGLPLAKLDVMTPERYSELAAAGGLDEFDVFVFDRWVPRPADSKQAPPGAQDQPVLPPGGALIFGEVPALRGLTRGAPLEEPAVMLDWSRDHPAFAGVNLENLIISRPISLMTTSDIQVIGQSSAGPAIIEAAEGGTRALVVAFDVSESNWPFDVGFVLFTASSLRYLGDRSGTLATEVVRPGDTLSTRLPAGATAVEVILPGGGRAALVPESEGRVNYGPLRRAGLYTINWSGPPGPGDEVLNERPQRRIAVNLLDPMESRIEARSTLDLPAGAVAAAGAAGQGAMVDVWTWMLLGAIVIMMIEWIVYNRKVHL